MRILRFYILLSALIAFSPISLAKENTEFKLSDPNWMNNSFLSNQRSAIDGLARRHFGTQIHGNKSDLHTLQRLIDKEVIARDDTTTLQALGVVLGDVYLSEYDQLHWQVLEDELGRSQVVCIKNTQHCLFPITMLSRRIEAGLNPNVETVFNKGLNKIKPFFPKLPFAED